MQHTEVDFDAYICLLRSHVLQLRLPLDEPEKHRRLDEWWHDIVLAMTSARLAKARSQDVLVGLLKDLNGTLAWYWRAKTSDPLDHWARNAFFTYEERMKHKTPFYHPFVLFSTKFRILGYVEAEIRTGRYSWKGGIPLLSYAVEFLANRRKTVYPLSTPMLVSMLLENGKDPNLRYKDLSGKETTPWLLTLNYVREADRRGWIRVYDIDENGSKRWVQILRLFILYGADPNALLLADSWDPAATALDVVGGVYEKYVSQDLKELNKLLLASGATKRACEGV